MRAKPPHRRVFMQQRRSALAGARTSSGARPVRRLLVLRQGEGWDVGGLAAS